jgi:hypothetical protein
MAGVNLYNIRQSYTAMSNPQAGVRPGLKAGRSNEFTLILPLKPGGAERLRKKMGDTYKAQDQSDTDRIGTIHDMRFVIFDNDTRLFFASTFDDFGTIIPDVIDFQFGECEGYPGIHSPDIKDYIVKHQVTATHFYSAYPNASVRDVWKALKIKGGIDVVLDEATA